MSSKYLVIVFYIIQFCSCMIYDLNDTEYDRMPPLFELEKYASCLTQQKGIYCLAQIELYAEPENELMHLIKEYSEHTVKHYNHSKIERGICLTKTCKQYFNNYTLQSVDELRDVLAKCVTENLHKEYALNGELKDFHCNRKNDEPHKDVYDWIVLFLFIILISLNVAGSTCDVIIRRQKLEKNNCHAFKYYLLCFSIFQNWNWLVAAEAGDERLLKIKGLHCLKTLVVYIFIIGHVFYIFHGFTENPHQFEKYYDYAFFKLIFSGMVLVQILFTISGFLLIYYLLLESEKTPMTWKLVPKIILSRIWRLTPANAVYVIFSATWLRHWGSGPLWSMIIHDKMSGDCRRYWWAHLLFVNNVIPDDRYCVVQNWQLAVDVQLFIFGLLVFVATSYHKRIWILASFAILGMLLQGLQIWWQDLDAFFLTTPEVYRNFESQNLNLHKLAHVNAPAFIIGMISGQIAYKWQKENFDLYKYKKLLSKICYFVIPFMLLIMYSGSFFYVEKQFISLSLRISYGILQRPVMSLVTAFVILGMIMKFDDFWLRFLEWDGWVMPSKLSYSMSLVHTFFIVILYGSRSQLVEISFLNHTLVHLSIAILSFAAAIPYFLMIEAPMNRMLKLVITRNVVKKKVE